MKRWYKRLAAGLLTGAILVSSLGAGAYAESTDPTVTENVESTVETNEETESIDETESETEIQTETETEEETEEPEQKELKAVTNLKAVGVEENTVKLDWDAAEGADGYLIYRQIGKTSFEYLAETEETTYTDSSASAEEYNYYRVYPYYMDGETKVTGPSDTYVYAKGIAQVTLAPVGNLKAVACAQGQIRLKWDEVEGADGYLIYRQIGNGKFEYRYMVSRTEYTDKTASETEYNFYRVYPYVMVGENRVVGPSDTYVYATAVLPRTLTAVTNLKAAAVGKGSVNLKWDAVEGADNYLIYRQIGDGSFEYLYMVSKTEYTDKTASEDEYNYYRVYPTYVNNFVRITGPSDAYVYAKGSLPVYLEAVKNLSANTAGKSHVYIRWDAVEGAEGYLIYRSIGGGKFEYLYMKTTTDYSDLHPSEDEYNYYRVYPYYTYEGRRIVGPSDTYVYAKGRFDQGWHWIGGYKRYVKEDGEIDNDVSRLVSGPYLIKVYKWGNYLIVFAKDENGEYKVPVKAMITSCGENTPTGTYYSPNKFRWLTMVGGSKAQWCTQISGDYLFHSVPYRIEDPTTLYVDSMYNYLGTTQSLGCIRLQAGEAKWIYDNCELGTEIYITPYEDSGPIPKPDFQPIPSWHTWDPTDPTTRYLCEENGCH